MIKALLKKQLLEFFSGFLNKDKNGKMQSKGAKAGIFIVLGIAGISFIMMFFSFAFMLSSLIADGFGWLYFALTGLLASLFGIMGSVFLTYNTIYEAKDNDLLLSMPIPSRVILLVRLTGLYLTCLLFESLISMPSLIVYFMTAPFSISVFLISFINLFILPFAAIGISLILGWLIALFSSKIRNKSIVSVIFSLLFFGIYYLGALRINEIINLIVTNAQAVGEAIKKWLYPIYKMGQGCVGDILSYLIYFVIVFLFLAVIYAVLSHSFLKLATAKRGMKKAVYKEKKAKRSSVRLAFFKKELLFFKNTPIYILNCALGSVMCIIFAVLFIFNNETIVTALSVLTAGSYDSLIVLCAVILCFIASTNNLTAASVSLEGKTLWLLKSVPVDVKDIFFGKLMLHISVTGIPLFIADIMVAAVLRTDILSFILMAAFSQLFVFVCAATGLSLNIIFPKTEWVNETVPIKQSMSVFGAMLAGMLYSVIPVLIYLLTEGVFSPYLYFIVYIAVFGSTGFFCYLWLGTKGQKKFVCIGN